MPKSDISPNIDFIRSRFPTLKQEALARRLGLAIGTLRLMESGQKVTRNTIEDIADKMNVPIRQLIIPDRSHWLPQDIESYTKLEFGYFIDHNRYSSGTVKWWNERVNLTRVRAPKGFPGIHFSGKVINQWGSTFAVRGLLPNVHHFSLIGIEETGSAGEHICFNASFSKQIDGVLCGTWSGINHVESIPAIYRIFLSPKPLNEADLQSLTRAARIEPHLKSSEIGFSEVQ